MTHPCSRGTPPNPHGAVRRPLRVPPRLFPVAFLLACLPPAGGCLDVTPGTTGPIEGEVDVLFVGNSLTASHNLPAMVDALAEADGVEFPYGVQAISGFGLGDHWGLDLESVIDELSPEIVVLQQGPSSLESSRDYLLEWTETIDQVVRANGGRSALFMVWPEEQRAHVFDDVREHYAEAATLVDGIFIPAGETWRAAWDREPALQLYGFDGFHPSRTGSVAAALTIWAMLSGSPDETPSCPAEVLVDPATAEVLCDAMREAVQTWGAW